jgi:hypothetical protein
MRARVYRNLERTPRLLGLEAFDALVWALSLFLVVWRVDAAIVVAAVVWVGLFALRYNRPPRFLARFLRFHGLRIICRNRFSAGVCERAHKPWLAMRSGR